MKINGLKNQISTTLKAGQSLTLPTFWHVVGDFKLAGIQGRTHIPTVDNASDFKHTIVQEDNGETSIVNPETYQQGADNRYYVISNLDITNGKQLNVSNKD